jgi:hypothetical protein
VSNKILAKQNAGLDTSLNEKRGEE